MCVLMPRAGVGILKPCDNPLHNHETGARSEAEKTAKGN